jgi:hypothetical protein
MEQSNFIESLITDPIFKKIIIDPLQFPFYEYKAIFQEEFEKRYKFQNIKIGEYHFQEGQVNLINSDEAPFKCPELIITLNTIDLVFYYRSYESFGKEVNFVELPANEDGSVELRGIVGKFILLDKELDVKVIIYGGIVCHISILVFKSQ